MRCGLWLTLCLLAACSAPYDDATAQQISTHKDAPVLFSRDTQRIARRRGATWLSTEPLLCWSKTPLSLRLSDSLQLTREQASEYAIDLLHAMLWAANAHGSTRSFANYAFGRLPDQPILWEDLALKVSFWNAQGDRFPSPYVAQLIVQQGMITTWTSDAKTQKVLTPITLPLPPRDATESAAGSSPPYST